MQKILLMISFLLTVSAPLLADTSNRTIKGYVLDEDGAPLPGHTYMTKTNISL